MAKLRATAARILVAVSRDGASLARELPQQEAALPPEQRPLLRELCYGTLRYYWQLHGMLAPLLQKPLRDKDADVLMLLYLGAYQLDHTRVAAHAAINNTVAACESLGKHWAKGLVNAVLRRFQRERENLHAGLDPAQACAHPAWLYDALKRAWPEDFESVLAANNAHPPLCLRVNHLRGTREHYLQTLAEQGIAASACRFAGEGVRLAQPRAVTNLPGFAAGAVSVQDESAQLAASLLDLQPGQRVLDACAAPGGKTCHLLETQPQLGEVVALDIDESRLQRVRENLDRLQLQATLLAGDAAAPQQWWDGQAFDRLLLDAPCSATGVIRRNPDIKLHRRAGDIPALAATQHRLLEALWPLLAPGGVLLYATCSVLPDENEAVAAAFLAQCPQAQLLPIDAEWGQAGDCGRQLLTTVGGHDGFYYARLKKRSDVV